MAELKPPIIIIGNVRSGTSLLQNMLAMHPTTVKWYEPRTLWMYADPGRNCDEFSRDDADDRVIKYIRNRFLHFQQRNGDLRIIEKTPQNILRVPYVDAIFPEATYIYLVRHPLSFISSCEPKWQRVISRKGIVRRLKTTPASQLHYYGKRLVKGYFDKYVLKKKYMSMWGTLYEGIGVDVKKYDIWTVIARQWAISAQKAERDLGMLGAGRVFKLRYEDLLAEPERYLTKLFGHCQLAMDAAAIRDAAELVDPNRRDTWRRLNVEVVRRLLPEIEAEMRLYGYTIPDEIEEAWANVA